jgi:hypothetical protein
MTLSILVVPVQYRMFITSFRQGLKVRVGCDVLHARHLLHASCLGCKECVLLLRNTCSYPLLGAYWVHESAEYHWVHNGCSEPLI